MDKRQTVRGFLKLCVRYSEDSIARKQKRIGTEEERAGDQNELSRWNAYCDFTKHAIKEIEGGVLDSWFDHLEEDDDWRPLPGDAAGRGCDEIDTVSEFKSLEVSNLDFQERSKILDSLVSPRPLVLASTKSNDGISNLCGLSSMMVISNHPPQIALSLSEDRNGRKRDTLINLQESGKIILHVLPASLEMASIINSVSKPIPREESEWEQIEVTSIQGPSGKNWPDIFPLALAALECELIQIHELPEGAVANLCILGVRNILSSESMITKLQNGMTLESLCQHGSYRLTPAPNGWGFICES